MRSALFVPGDDQKKMARGLASGADALILDLEDSVAAAQKGRARRLVAEFLGASASKTDRPRLLVRVNPLDSGLIDLDLDAIMPARPEGVMLPKSLSGASVQHLGVKLAVREAQCSLVEGSTRIIAIATESAAALFAMASYRAASRRLEGLAWGGEDLSADIGAEANRLADGSWAGPYVLARNLTLLAATAAQVAPIDTVFTNTRDLDGLRAEALAARRDGFTAKMAIHPTQIAVINEVFAPAPEALAKAQAIISAFAAAPEAGVVAIEGEMYDRPHLLRAQRLAARAKPREA
ncbi:MAG TPA: CoA ester lyase [Roseiarcus sp.]|nr:CoA ester lyase [Roseiarcus sp.]